MNYESETLFFYSSRHHIFESENFRFTFFYEKEPTLGCKMKKLNFRKLQNYDKLGKLYMNGTVI